MGRTIPSFRIALAMEKEEWKSFSNALDKTERKKFLMRCGTFLDCTSQLVLILVGWCHFILYYVYFVPSLQRAEGMLFRGRANRRG
ncbi:MAG: hypothetical protein M3299_09315 [Thermoproteota archaeon]|nr:hypothetical protein [Thermoproteota archaeon]